LLFPQVLAPVAAHFGECGVCYESQPFTAFAEFCFKEFRVTGDSMETAGPRHPRTICRSCLCLHARSAVRAGKLYVRCPSVACGRSLQTLELQSLMSASDYLSLIAALRDAESAAAAGENAQDLAAPEGLELRLCPRCHVRIEKNEGCSSMQCYRCGELFQWDEAALVRAPAPSSISSDSTPNSSLPPSNAVAAVAPRTASTLDAELSAYFASARPAPRIKCPSADHIWSVAQTTTDSHCVCDECGLKLVPSISLSSCSVCALKLCTACAQASKGHGESEEEIAGKGRVLSDGWSETERAEVALRLQTVVAARQPFVASSLAAQLMQAPRNELMALLLNPDELHRQVDGLTARMAASGAAVEDVTTELK